MSPEPLYRFDSSREESEAFITQVAIVVGDLGSSSRAVITEDAKRLVND
jgi:hypothetical protein